MLTIKRCLWSLWLGEHERIAQISEVVPIVDFFCEYIWNIEFPHNVEVLDFFKMDKCSDVVIAETYVFHSICCEKFWPVHTGVVAIVTLGWNEEKNMGQVWEGMS